MSPTSPRSSTGVDHTSFHERAKSPDETSEGEMVEDDVDGPETARAYEGGEEEEADEVDELGAIQELDDPRLSRISVSRMNHGELTVNDS